MKKILLRCVYKTNLGDDLLIKVLCERYKNCRFYIINEKNGNIIDKPPNLIVINPCMLFYRIFRKIAHFFKKKNLYDVILLKKMDYVVSIAGSIFMEDKKNSNLSEKLLWFSNLKLPFFMIGSNIGPVYTENYIKLIKEKILCKAKDVCLRDIKSYDLVADCKNVRYAADVVFNLDVSKYTSISSRRKVIISVINIDMKAKQIVSPNKEKYQRVIIELIKYFKNKNYEVELFSFCENEEKDEEAIDEIISLIENKNEKVSKYFYNGNIDDAITELASGKIIIGSRFHANVLAMLLKKNIIPIIYNDKTREMLKDINFQGKFIDIEKIDEFNISDLSEDVLNYKHDITREIENAELQFEALDKELERK